MMGMTMGVSQSGSSQVPREHFNSSYFKLRLTIADYLQVFEWSIFGSESNRPASMQAPNLIAFTHLSTEIGGRRKFETKLCTALGLLFAILGEKYISEYSNMPHACNHTSRSDLFSMDMSKLCIAKLLTLACAIGAQAFHVRSLPRSVTDVCPGAQEVESSTFNVNDLEFVRQTFVCPNGNFSVEAFSDTNSASSIPHLSSLEARSQVECTTPATTCQCGTAVDCACFTDGIAPSTSDCRTLIGSTGVIASTQGPTFMIQPDTLHAITLNTCTLGFLNLASFVEEFCWDDLVSYVRCIASSLMTDSIIICRLVRPTLSWAVSLV
ncbi:hypothetical protein ACEPAH_1640 [Sanghuangporus vaninii]